MTTITITIGGSPHSVEATPEQVAALGATRVTYNERVTELDAGKPEEAQRPTFSDPTEFLKEQVLDRLAQHPDEVPTDIMARALANWAGVPVPEPVAADLSPEARRTRLVALAAEKRWQVATAGVTVNDVHVPSDDPSSTRIRSTIRDIDEGIISEPVTFVVGDVVVPATRTLLQAMRVAISARWQSAYAVQGELVSGILADTITEDSQVMSASWPT